MTASATNSPDMVVPQARSLISAARWQPALLATTLVVSAAVVLAHLGLLPGGAWGADEYSNFVRFRDFGLDWYFVRLWDWSPRPLSDGVLYLYALAVDHWRAPLITPFLGLLCAVLIGGTLWAAWQRKAQGVLNRLTFAAVVLATFFVGHKLNSLFYWPMGAAAYLLDLAGVAVVTMQIFNGGTAKRAGRLACLLALVVAATSSETGLFFALAFTMAMLLLALPVLARPRRTSEPAYSLWFLVPLVVSLAIAACLLHIVATNPARGINQASVYFHHVTPSLLGTLQTSVTEVLLGGRSPGGLTIPSWLATLAMFFLGALWACPRGSDAPAAWRPVAALFAGLAGGYFLTLFTMYFEYGSEDHQPQMAFRKCLILLGLLPVAWLVNRCFPQLQRRLHLIGPAALLGVVALGAISRIPAMKHDYRLLPEMRQARSLTWHSANTPGATLRFFVPPRGALVLGQIPPAPGHFVRGAQGVADWENAMMDFFHKRELEFISLSAQGTR